MQNSKNQPSAFDSPNNHLNGNGRIYSTPVSNDTIEEVIQPSDPVTEPDFLIYLNGNSNGYLAPLPQPDTASVQAEALEATRSRSRSWRMQWRFFRTLIFAAWMFFRLIFWQVYVAKVFPGWVEHTNLGRWKIYARQFSRFAVKMGGLFIKMGQFISTRVDILPEEIIAELENLQDEVPTIEFKLIQQAVERELGRIDSRFTYFNPQPIAAASLGQVHKAILKNGDKVVVKVQRPGIREVCYTDLAAMRVVAKVAMKFAFFSNRADVEALVEEFGRVFLEELSYKHEARNAERFSKIFKDDMGVYIPSIYPEHSTDHVLTIEDVSSIKITDYAAMEKAGISRKAVATRLMDTYLTQVFDHYFFHADPHPGNLFVYPLPVDDVNANFGEAGRPFYLIFVDFGMTGTLTREIADGMVSTLWAVLARDAKKLVQSYADLGFLLPGADVDRIIEATQATFDKVWGLSMAEIRDIDYKQVTDLADEFSDLLLAMPFYIPQDFLYLGRTISILSGMCTNLDPSYNPWHELEPYTEKLIARGFGINIPKGQRLNGSFALPALQSLLTPEGGKVMRTLGEEVLRRTFAPITSPVTNFDSAMQELRRGEIHVISEPSLAYRQQFRRLEKESRKVGRSVFFGSVLVSSTLLYTNGDTTVALLGYGLCGLTVIVGFLKD